MAAFTLPALDSPTPVRVSADWGRLHLDRPLPCLGVCQVSQRVTSSDRTLIEGWPAYLVYSQLEGTTEDVSSSPDAALGTRALAVLQHVARERIRRFGAFLVVELNLLEHPAGGATIRVRSRAPHPDVLGALASGLEPITRLGDVPALQVRQRVDPAALLSPPASTPGYWLTIDLDPLHFDPETGRAYPMVGRALEIVLDEAIRECWFQFLRHHTSVHVRSAAAVGRRHLLAPEWSTDRALTRINESYDFLLNITPTNSVAAWHEFEASGFERAPRLRYRPVDVDPEELRRALFQIPIHHAEDPTLAQLFRAEQEGIDQKLRMLEQRDTPRFIFDSLHLYGMVEDELLQHALNVLQTVECAPAGSPEPTLDADEFARVAEARLQLYKEELPAVTSRVEVRDDVASVMVAQGNLLVPESTRCPLSRVEGLLAHELGTHVVTYFNGRAQRLKLFASGLSGADELQEGLAVLAEALLGALTPARLRLLAGRVLAVHRLTQGATFVDVFRELTQQYGFKKRKAFGIALRVFRGGGFTKDAIYLRGLQTLLDYLARGEPLEMLFVGKFAFNHIPLVRQLLEREILQPPALTPHHLRLQEAQDRLRDLKQVQELHGLLPRRAA